MARGLISLVATAMALGGCASQAQLLAQSKPMAMQTAESRGKFEMDCQEATPTLLSQEVVQPAIEAPLLGGVQRFEYTIGVSGCGKRKTFVVICPEGGGGCFAAGPGPFVKE